MRLFYLSLTLGLLFLSNTMDAQITNLGNFNFLSNNVTFYPTSKTKIGNRLFFVAPFDQNNGKAVFVRDIWMSDGTVSGTKALNIRDLHGITMQSNDSLIFYKTYKNRDNDNIELHQLDGRTLTKTKIFDGYAIGEQFIFKNELLFFTAKDSLTPKADYLYSYNVNTRQLNKIAPSAPFVRNAYSDSTNYAFNGTTLLYWAYLRTNVQSTPYELWRTDGTTQGTYKLDATGSTPLNLHVFKGKFYFNQSKSGANGEAWTTDGTSKPTKLTTNFNFSQGAWTEKGFIGVTWNPTDVGLWFSDFSTISATNISNSVFDPKPFVQLKDKVYFFAQNDSCTLAFYETDGTRTGTRLVKPLVNRKEASYSEQALQILQANGKIYAEIMTPQYGHEMLVSDGTTQGTTIADIWKGGGNSYYLKYSYRPIDFTDKNAYFIANNGISGTQIWQANGTDNTVSRVSDNTQNRSQSNTQIVGGIGNQLIFSTQKDSILSIWRFDETQPKPFQEDIKRQNYKWLTSLGSIGYYSYSVEVAAISADTHQNTFVLGKYSENNFAFFDTTHSLVRNQNNRRSYPDDNLFIVKYDSIGKILWSKDLFSSSDVYVKTKTMTTDAAGNVYVMAQNRHATSSPNEIVLDNTLIHSGSSPVNFILKFDTNGKLLWSKKVFTSADFVNIVTKDKNLYITGKSYMNFSIDNVTVPANSFAIKLTETGKVEWATALNKDTKLEISSLSIDNLGNLITSDVEGNVSKFQNDNGNILWTKNLPLSRNAKITTQNDGSVFILTDFNNTASFGNKTIYSKGTGLASVGLSAAGDVFQAVVLDQNAGIIPLNVKTDDKDVFRVIYYKEKDETPVLIYPNWGIYNRRSLIVKQFTTTGLTLAEKEIFTRLEYPQNLMAEFDAKDDCVFAGRSIWYMDTIPNIPLTDLDYHVIARFSLRGQNVEPKDEALELEDISLSPNPVSNFITLSSKDGDFRDANILIYNVLGQLQNVITTHSDLGVKTIDVSKLNKGVHILVIQKGDKKLTTKFSKF